MCYTGVTMGSFGLIILFNYFTSKGMEIVSTLQSSQINQCHFLHLYRECGDTSHSFALWGECAIFGIVVTTKTFAAIAVLQRQHL